MICLHQRKPIQPMKVLASRTLLAALHTSEAPAGHTRQAYIEATETVDAANARDKAKHVDFGSAIAAAILKKEVPVLVVTDQTKAHWTIKSVSSQREDSTGTKIAKL